MRRALLLTVLLPHLAHAIPQPLVCLLQRYPEAICAATATELVWCDGSRMPLHDGGTRTTHQARLNHADLSDQMAQVYTPFVAPTPPAQDFEPGRIRDEPFFAKLYGQTEREVRRTLRPVRWLDGKILMVQGKFGIDKQLTAVRDELMRLPEALVAPIRQTAGTFVWRRIHGTQRRSAHAYGTAIDVGVRTSNYWQWNRPDASGKRAWRNRIQREVVEVFERHGFIWGGRWDHYDTMHFEFRPELLHPGCVGRSSR